MTFQTSVAAQQGFGVVGEIFLNGVMRAQPGIVDSDGVTYPNRVGRVFTQVAGADGHCTVAGSGVFYGILANPKVYPTSGGSTGSLSPSLDVLQYSVNEFVYNTTGIIVSLPAAANVGDLCDYDTTTGIISARLGTQPSTGAQRVAYASNVATVTLTPAGAPAIGLGSVFTTADGQSVRVLSLGTGTGGNGTYNVSGAVDHAAQAFSYTSVPASGTARVPGFQVVRYSPAGAGLAVIGCIN